MALQRVRGQLRSAGSGKFSTIHGLDQGAKSLHTHLTVSESFCARESALKTEGGVEVFFRKVKRPPCTLICLPEGLLESRLGPLP